MKNTMTHPLLISHSVIRDLFHNAKHIALAAHIRPDGDAVGSLLGLGNALLHHGKQIQMILTDGVPASHRELPNAHLIKKKLETPADLYISLDCSDLKRLGNPFEDRVPHLNIDHHISNTYYAEFNYVEPQAAATAEVIASHLKEWGLTFDKDSATPLLAGIITDTIGFRTGNTTSMTLRLAADLIDQGADLYNTYYQNLTRQPVKALRLWEKSLSQMTYENQLIYASISLADKRSAGYDSTDDADFINLLSTIDDVKIAIVFVELSKDLVKVSWRAAPGYDVSKIATMFGGGGHVAASGAEVKGSLTQVKELIINTTKQLMSEEKSAN